MVFSAHRFIAEPLTSPALGGIFQYQTRFLKNTNKEAVMEFSKGELKEMLKAAESAARYAAEEIILPRHQTTIAYFLKRDKSIATDIEISAEFAIREYLSGLFGEFGFWGEELGAAGPQEIRWTIDPVDDTEFFVRKIPGWSIMIGFECEGEALLGAIYDPLAQKMLAAFKGGESLINGSPVWVSIEENLSNSFLLHYGIAEYEGDREFRGLLDAFSIKRGMGGYLATRWISSGNADAGLFLGLGGEDIVPIQAFIRGANGKITDLRGNDKIGDGNIIVSNGLIHDQMLRILNP